jgi:hypothetical protein
MRLTVKQLVGDPKTDFLLGADGAAGSASFATA